MAIGDKDKLNRLEELKNKLFSKNYEQKKEHRDKFTEMQTGEVKDSWGDETNASSEFSDSSKNFFMKTSIFKNFFYFSLIFFVLTLIYASFMFFKGGNTVSNENIDISVVGSNFVAGGEDLSFVVEIKNRNSSSLDLADLIVEYPKSSSISGINSTERNRISIGKIPAGEIHYENIKLILFGEQGSLRSLKISLEYRVEGSNAIFVKEKPYEVTISSTPLNISVEGPSIISPNQDINLNVKVVLNSTKPATRTLIKIDYPVGFVFTSSLPSPSLGNNIWSLGDIPPGGEKEIAILGKMLDVFDGEQKAFQISSGIQSFSDKSMFDIVYNSVSHIVAISRPFIEANLFINGVAGREYVSATKNSIGGRIEWKNNLDTNLNDLEIRAKIKGNAVNEKTIGVEQGFYNSSTDTIVWDKNSVSKFKEISPGDSGSVNFSFAPVSLFSAGSGVLASPIINIEVSISGKQLTENYASKDLENLSSATIRIISDVGFTNKILYYSGPFTNKGAIPPKVEKETTYTITWSLSNTANNISKGIVTSSLPSWVKFLGTISPTGEDLVYNSSTRGITWNVGFIPKGAGVTGIAKSISFQVGFSPSLSQLRSSPTLINEATLTGYDDFAKVDIRVNKESLNTVLDNDPMFPSGGGSVVE